MTPPPSGDVKLHAAPRPPHLAMSAEGWLLIGETMLGERLRQAGRIAEKRASRYDYEGWPKYNGIFRKWNGTCGCRTCRAGRERYKSKGLRKAQWHEYVKDVSSPPAE